MFPYCTTAFIYLLFHLYSLNFAILFSRKRHERKILYLILIFLLQAEPVFGDQRGRPGRVAVPLWNQKQPLTRSVILLFQVGRMTL